MGNTPSNTARPTEQHLYVAIDKDVRRGVEVIARTRSHNMAKRIAFALNLYDKQYNLIQKRRKTLDK